MIRMRVLPSSPPDAENAIGRIEKAFQQALDRFVHVIREGDIALKDINGPKGGRDKCCRVQLRLLPRGLVVMRGYGSSYLEAANEVCDKMRHALAKRLEKRRHKSRKLAPPAKTVTRRLVDRLEQEVVYGH